MGEDSRTFVRGLESDNYELEAVRQLQLSHHRVRDESIVTDTGTSSTTDEPTRDTLPVK